MILPSLCNYNEGIIISQLWLSVSTDIDHCTNFVPFRNFVCLHRSRSRGPFKRLHVPNSRTWHFPVNTVLHAPRSINSHFTNQWPNQSAKCLLALVSRGRNKMIVFLNEAPALEMVIKCRARSLVEKILRSVQSTFVSSRPCFTLRLTFYSRWAIFWKKKIIILTERLYCANEQKGYLCDILKGESYFHYCSYQVEIQVCLLRSERRYSRTKITKESFVKRLRKRDLSSGHLIEKIFHLAEQRLN